MAKKRNLNKVDLRTVKVRVSDNRPFGGYLIDIRFSTRSGVESGYIHTSRNITALTQEDIDTAVDSAVSMMHSIEEQEQEQEQDEYTTQWQSGARNPITINVIGSTATDWSVQEYEAAYEASTNAKTSGSR